MISNKQTVVWRTGCTLLLLTNIGWVNPTNAELIRMIGIATVTSSLALMWFSAFRRT